MTFAESAAWENEKKLTYRFLQFGICVYNRVEWGNLG